MRLGSTRRRRRVEPSLACRDVRAKEGPQFKLCLERQHGRTHTATKGAGREGHAPGGGAWRAPSRQMRGQLIGPPPAAMDA